MSIFLARVKMLRDMLREYSVEGILVTQQVNFSWLTGGRAYINGNSEGAVAPILITKDRVFLIANNIEAQRLKEEEIGDEIEVIEYDWYEANGQDRCIYNALGNGKFITDVQLKKEISLLRYTLCEEDIERYRVIGKLVGQAVEETCREISPGMSEWEISGVLCKKCLDRGLEPFVHLVGTDWRAEKYRHPLPTDKKVDKYALVAVNAMKYGLWVSATRLVCFGRVPDEIRKRFEAVVKVDACFIASTRPGNTVGQVFKKAMKAYEESGFEGQWKCHHQGGLTGYSSREYKATPDMDTVIGVNQAFAWNPSISGTKSEDTILVLEGGNEIITQTGEYPLIEVEYEGHRILRPDILVR